VPGSISVELSEVERSLILAMRGAVKAEVRILTECLDKADKFRYELTSANRYLRAENIELSRALINHGIEPVLPCSQFTGTPSPSRSN